LKLDRALQQARCSIDDAASRVAWAIGQAMSLDQAVDEALKETDAVAHAGRDLVRRSAI